MPKGNKAVPPPGPRINPEQTLKKELSLPAAEIGPALQSAVQAIPTAVGAATFGAQVLDAITRPESSATAGTSDAGSSDHGGSKE